MVKNSRIPVPDRGLKTKKGAFERLFLLALVVIFSQPGRLSAADTPRLPGSNSACKTPAFDEVATISTVYDGDTVRLTDGRKIRLIGINTPELARESRPAQPFAIQARNRLKQLVSEQNTVHLVYGREHHDHYQRTLAHLFLPSGLNIQTDLVQQGLAFALTHPPNVAFSDCYHSIEMEARRQKKGLWATDSASIKDARTLNPDTAGFLLLKSRIDRVNSSEKGLSLYLAGGILVRVHQDDLPYFASLKSGLQPNTELVIRGWLKPYRSQKDIKFYIRCRHPSSIRLITDEKV